MASRKERDNRFEGLVAFANLGDSVADWRHFRAMHPHFFPQTPFNCDHPGFHDMTDWLYTWAEEWAEIRNEVSRPEVMAQVPTPLLWYRNRLRAVWVRDDPDGINLMILYGLEKAAMEKAKRLGSPVPEGITRHLLPAQMPGEAFDLEKTNISVAGLPPGQPEVDGITGKIRWKFGCEFQELVRDLMDKRWRAMVCPTCGKFFMADKTAQKHCSTDCYAETKRLQALERWHAKGDAERQAKKARNKRKARVPGSKPRVM